MDKLIAETVEELGNDERLNAKELYEKYSKDRTLSSSAATNYKQIKARILGWCKHGNNIKFNPSDLGYNYSTGNLNTQIYEIVLSMLREDGFYIDTTNCVIAWDERIPAVVYAVDGPEYQKMKALVEKN